MSRRRRPWRRCSSCRGVCHWHDEAWVCDACGDEWYPDHGKQYAAPVDPFDYEAFPLTVDGAGYRARVVPATDVVVGLAIHGGWKPHPVVVGIERDDAVLKIRFRFEDERWKDGRPGSWIPFAERVYVVDEVEREAAA